MRKQRAERLRFAVDTLPPETQRAMLQGINENRIVTGANTDRRGGVCPMLAADRNAFAVTPLAEIFATAWDHYTGTTFVNVTRRVAAGAHPGPNGGRDDALRPRPSDPPLGPRRALPDRRPRPRRGRVPPVEQDPDRARPGAGPGDHRQPGGGPPAPGLAPGRR